MSKLKDGMILYHGSYAIIEQIDLGRCSRAKDFGRGFYLTSDENQARSFIAQSIRKARMSSDYGYVSAFRYHASDDDIKTYEFATTDRSWLWFIAQNRREHLAERLAHRVDSAIFGSDIIIGKIANDQTNATIATYLSGLYGDVESDEAVADTIKRLMPEKLSDQYCFRTQRAVELLEFVEAKKYDI
jgi:hypothetical protein